MKYTSALLLLLLLSADLTNAQQSPKAQRAEQRDDVVRVTTNLVQIDAVITDKTGRPVTDLQPEDFELFENGRARQITAFSYVPLTATGSNSAALNQNVAPKIPAAVTNLPPLTPSHERATPVRRTIAILIDDFGLSFESTANVRQALEKFIAEQTSPDDLVGIIRASGGPGALQQFTSDRRRLLTTVKALRWYPTGRGHMSAVDSMDPLDNDVLGLPLHGYRANHQLNVSGNEFMGGTVGALNFVVQGLAALPGRKVILLISDNLPVTNKEAQADGATRALDNLIERANQSSVVIYTMDARGMPKIGMTADDSQYNLAANQIDTRTRMGPVRFRAEQSGLNYLAKQTGGIFIHDTNDLSDGIRRVLDEEQGYYLIGYRPDDSGSEPVRAPGHSYKVTLRLHRPDLFIRTRSAYHRGATGSEAEGATKTRSDSLHAALTSPVVRDEVHLKMTALFTGRSQVKILLHVDARDLDFNKSGEENYQGSFDVAVVAFDNNGKVANQVGRTQTLRVKPDGHDRLLRDGFVYSITLPLETPGAYQVRLGLRDAASGKIGSDSQFIEVPDTKKPRLTLAGFIVQAPDEITSEQGSETSTGPAVRRFAAGDLINYSYLIYGARRNGPFHAPDLLSQVRLVRSNQEVFTGGLVPLTNTGAVGEGLVAGGSLRLGKGLPPGEYFLQVTVTDKLAPADKQSSDQWIDFEIVKKP